MCRKGVYVLFTIWTLGAAVLVLGSEDDEVVSLEGGTFDDWMNEQNGELWLVEFYAPWCSFCIKFRKNLSLLSRELKGKVKVGAINVDLHRNVMERFDLEYLPTFLFFGEDKSNPKFYAGEISLSALKIAALHEFQRMKRTPQSHF